jgi:hypothetical protein
MALSAGQCPAQNCTQLQFFGSADEGDLFVARDGIAAQTRGAIESMAYTLLDMGVSAAHDLCHSGPGAMVIFE